MTIGEGMEAARAEPASLEPEVVARRLKRRERVVHPPRVAENSRAECYLGRRVHILNVYERCGHACSYCFAE